MDIECIRAHIQSGGKSYPIYVGFATAEAISRVAVAPAFAESTSNQEIASNVSDDPVKDWQRPLSDDRVQRIAAAFNDSGSLMPNPVLLAKNAFSDGITIEPKKVEGADAYQSGTFLVSLDESATDPASRPLWILDGQHRIAGLSQSKQKSNPVPLVLLLDGGGGAFSGPLLASLFAQVTTSATKLDDLHNEWLTYAFQLGKYDQSAKHAPAASQGFKAVVELCRTSAFNGVENPFFNDVQFNVHLPSPRPNLGGFSFKCTTLADLFSRYYYANPSQAGHLEPRNLAEEVSRAYRSLHETVTKHDDSVFFGKSSAKQQVIVQEAWLVGILARLLAQGSTADYKSLFQGLQFQNTNWDFSWVNTLSGPANTVSKRIATSVFREALLTGALPDGNNNLADYLRGNGAYVDVVFSSVTDSGRPRANGKQAYRALRGSTGSQPAATTPHVKLGGFTGNVGEVQVLEHVQHGPPPRYREIEGRGLVLKAPVAKPLEITLLMSHYGGHTSSAELQINW